MKVGGVHINTPKIPTTASPPFSQPQPLRLGHICVMATDLSKALERLHLDDDFDSIDDILFEQAPRKRLRKSPAELKADLEKSYLLPSTTFSTEWLNKLQQ
jgi:hypothetical protein